MGDNGPLHGYSYVLENLAGHAWHDFDYMGMEVDESLASNLPSSYEAYQGDFLVMVRDLDVTPRTQVMFFKNVRVLMSSASTFASQMLGGRFSLPIILGLVSYDREWPRVMSSDQAGLPKIGRGELDVLMRQGGLTRMSHLSPQLEPILEVVNGCWHCTSPPPPPPPPPPWKILTEIISSQH
ncbi:hypothetical protein Tco_0901321 [Tanacetum coccineum]